VTSRKIWRTFKYSICFKLKKPKADRSTAVSTLTGLDSHFGFKNGSVSCFLVLERDAEWQADVMCVCLLCIGKKRDSLVRLKCENSHRIPSRKNGLCYAWFFVWIICRISELVGCHVATKTCWRLQHMSSYNSKHQHEEASHHHLSQIMSQEKLLTLFRIREENRVGKESLLSWRKWFQCLWVSDWGGWQGIQISSIKSWALTRRTTMSLC